MNATITSHPQGTPDAQRARIFLAPPTAPRGISSRSPKLHQVNPCPREPGQAKWLRGRRYLVTERYTIADIALYAYTHVAEEGGFELEPYPAIRAWLDRVAAQPGHVTINANESAPQAE